MFKPDDFKHIIQIDDAARAHEALPKSEQRPTLQHNRLPPSPPSFTEEEEAVIRAKFDV